MDTSELTRGQLERTLSQRIQAIYRHWVGRPSTKVTCGISENQLKILLEDEMTPAENFLIQQGKRDSVDKLRSDLEEVIRSQLKAEIESILGISILDFLSEVPLSTEKMSLVAILESSPTFRSNSRKKKTNSRKKKKVRRCTGAILLEKNRN